MPSYKTAIMGLVLIPSQNVADLTFAKIVDGPLGTW